MLHYLRFSSLYSWFDSPSLSPAPIYTLDTPVYHHYLPPLLPGLYHYCLVIFVPAFSSAVTTTYFFLLLLVLLL